MPTQPYERMKKSRDLSRFRKRAQAQGGEILGPVFVLRIPEKPDRLIAWSGSQWEWFSQ